jgi:hypothetical protein
MPKKLKKKVTKSSGAGALLQRLERDEDKLNALHHWAKDKFNPWIILLQAWLDGGGSGTKPPPPPPTYP